MSETNTALPVPSPSAPLLAHRSPAAASSSTSPHGLRLLDVGRLRRAAVAYLSACGVADDDVRTRLVDGLLASPTVESLMRMDGSIDAGALQRQLDRALAPSLGASSADRSAGYGRLMHAYGAHGVTAEQWRRDVTVRDDAPVEMPVQSLSPSHGGTVVRRSPPLVSRFVRAPVHAVALLVSVLLGGK